MMMPIEMKCVALALCMSGIAISSGASRPQEHDSTILSRPVVSTYTAEFGAVSVLDTYLTPLTHHGAGGALTGRWCKMMRSDIPLVMDFDGRLQGATATGPSGNQRLYDISVAFAWGVSRQWTVTPQWSLAAGACVGFDAGGIYLPKPGNNPASAKIDAMLSLRLAASWTATLAGRSITLFDRLTLPSFGTIFSPAYGETYYEIYLGNRRGLVHPAWWGNHFCVDNLIGAEWQLSSRALLVGYRLQQRTSWINHLNTHRTLHSLVIGFTLGRDKKETYTPRP